VRICKIWLYLDCLVKVNFCLLIATQLGKSRPKIVERDGMTGIDPYQILIKVDRVVLFDS